MKTEYITGGSSLPPSLGFPRFLLGMDVRLVSKEIYAILLEMAVNNARTDKRGRRYLVFNNKTIAGMIDRTPATVGGALTELENIGLIEKRLAGRNAPYHIYVKLPAGEETI